MKRPMLPAEMRAIGLIVNSVREQLLDHAHRSLVCALGIEGACGAAGIELAVLRLIGSDVAKSNDHEKMVATLVREFEANLRSYLASTGDLLIEADVQSDVELAQDARARGQAH